MAPDRSAPGAARDDFEDALDRVLTGRADLAAGGIDIEGDGAKLGELLSRFDAPDPDFAIVTP